MIMPDRFDKYQSRLHAGSLAAYWPRCATVGISCTCAAKAASAPPTH
jgi:hypothetical protein